MTTIYVVTKGSYSDYKIVAIFSEKSTADAYVTMREEQNKHWEGQVEEYELDAIADPLRQGLKLYTVVIARTGDIEEVGPIDNWDEPPEVGDYIYINKEAAQFYIWGHDEKHVAKIANERRTMLIATGQWASHEEEEL